ncbi:hypothetical protein [Frigidibacter sp. ROC022]|nr:hypothetical protein [Frigidibacter sp. ROC022]MCR8725457.1 hypothetical protein [Frigidibacter sp. ROC022]
MADRQQRGNKEAKKPKKEKAKPPASGSAPTDGLSISKMQGKGKK